MEVIRLFQSVGWVRNKHQFRTVQQNQKSFLLTQDWGWMVYTALDLWDLIVAVLHGNTYQSNKDWKDPHESPTRKTIHGNIDDLDNDDFMSSNVHSSRKEALLYIFEDEEAAINMIIKGRSPTMRYVSRTHRVALDWLFDSINLDTMVQIKYVDTKNQFADILTEVCHETNGIIFCVCSTSAISVPSIVLKRCWKEHKKMQVKKESQQNRSRWWIWSRDATHGILTCLPLLHQKAWGKPDMKVNYLWGRWMSSNQE